ncbi:hypothetical protein L3Q82_008095 [Scortum barcoo]|uniref:Uncharacterized protein n=1 Tax=Scortum barcoo TaxID=214431 RepID=A0ACB8WL00_9TELE|nr:hypothetical protein L3Q82_008095 [Scortum barcoo]
MVTVAESRTLDKLLDIMDNASHPLHTVISNQRSLFSERLLLPKCRTNRLKNSFSDYRSLALALVWSWSWSWSWSDDVWSERGAVVEALIGRLSMIHESSLSSSIMNHSNIKELLLRKHESVCLQLNWTSQNHIKPDQNQISEALTLQVFPHSVFVSLNASSLYSVFLKTQAACRVKDHICSELQKPPDPSARTQRTNQTTDCSGQGKTSSHLWATIRAHCRLTPRITPQITSRRHVTPAHNTV